VSRRVIALRRVGGPVRRALGDVLWCRPGSRV
jgi:hypothetical protein